MNANAVNQAGQTAAASYAEAQKTSAVTSGNVIGTPKLSEAGHKYYEQLKKKFSNMDFILVSEDKKAEAEADAGDYANENRMVVLIDTEKIEKMAADEKFRKQYEELISGATKQLAQIRSSVATLPAASNVRTYGMKVDDGGLISFFAVIDKSLADQRKRIETNALKKAEEEKKNDKKAAKKDTTETVTVTASSVEELLKKIKDTLYAGMSDNVQTEEEKRIGQRVDYSA